LRGLQQGSERTEAEESVSIAHMAKGNIKHEIDRRRFEKADSVTGLGSTDQMGNSFPIPRTRGIQKSSWTHHYQQ